MKKIWIYLLGVLPYLTFAQHHTIKVEAYEKLLNHFHTYVDKGELAGTVIFLEKDGILTKDTYGYQNIATQKNMSENSIFRLASMTKPIVATAVMQLVEKGKLDLEESAAKYIPALAKMSVYNGTEKGKATQKSITIRHLLSHTSGSTSALDLSDAGKHAAQVLAREKISNLKELVASICKTQLAFEAGEGWAYGYSNDLLAYIVEQVSGLTIDQYLEQSIFEPLQMKHTAFQVQDTAMLTAVHAYNANGELVAIGTTKNNRYTNGKNFARGNGGLVGTAGDYLNFCRMILNKGRFNGQQILQPQSVELMMENAVRESFLPFKVANNEMTGQGYGLGFGVAMENTPFGTTGDVYWPGSLYTFFFINPQNNAIGIFMTQLRDMRKVGMIWEFHDLATKAIATTN